MRGARQNEDSKAPSGKIREEPSFQQGLPGDRGGRQKKMAETWLSCCCRCKLTWGWGAGAANESRTPGVLHPASHIPGQFAEKEALVPVVWTPQSYSPEAGRLTSVPVTGLGSLS